MSSPPGRRGQSQQPSLRSETGRFESAGDAATTAEPNSLLYDSMRERESTEAAEEDELTEPYEAEALAAALEIELGIRRRHTTLAPADGRRTTPPADWRSGSDRSRSPPPATARPGGQQEAQRSPGPPPATSTGGTETDRRHARNALWQASQPTEEEREAWTDAGWRHVDLWHCPECFLPEGTVVRIRSHEHGWHQIRAGIEGWSWLNRSRWHA